MPHTGDNYRTLADAEVSKQGAPGVTEGAFAVSRARQMQHTEAAHRADAAHAASKGQEVVYTPIGLPVFRSR